MVNGYNPQDFSYFHRGENLVQHIDYSMIDSINVEDLRYNGLTDEENLKLFHSVNIMEIVSLVLHGLFNTLNKNA